MANPLPDPDLSADHVLRTTRAVRKRLDFDRPVPHEVIRECLEIALQAPTGSNRQNWHFVVVTDEGTMDKLHAELEYGNHNAPAAMRAAPTTGDAAPRASGHAGSLRG